MATATLFRPLTPSGYHRIVSPTLKVSEDLAIPIPVGLLACQRTFAPLDLRLNSLAHNLPL